MHRGFRFSAVASAIIFNYEILMFSQAQTTMSIPYDR